MNSSITNKSRSVLLFILGIVLSIFIVAHILVVMNIMPRESFVNRELLAYPGVYPGADNGGLLTGSAYQATGDKHTGDKGAADIWWQKPVFQVGSYKQLTNNIQYPNSTDDGSCTPAEFCDTMYKNRTPKSNETYPVDPVPDSGSRIGYFQRSAPGLKTFSNTGGNILY